MHHHNVYCSVPEIYVPNLVITLNRSSLVLITIAPCFVPLAQSVNKHLLPEPQCLPYRLSSHHITICDDIEVLLLFPGECRECREENTVKQEKLQGIVIVIVFIFN